jgi:hypothetical protein
MTGEAGFPRLPSPASSLRFLHISTISIRLLETFPSLQNFG